MCFRDFYTSIYNIHLDFIKIESKTGREEARAKPAKKTGSSKRSGLLRKSIPLPRKRRQWPKDRSQVHVGEQTSPRRALLCLGGVASSWKQK